MLGIKNVCAINIRALLELPFWRRKSLQAISALARRDNVTFLCHFKQVPSHQAKRFMITSCILMEMSTTI